MRKRIKRFGNGVGLYFTTEEVRIYGFKFGDIYDVELCKINDKQDEQDGEGNNE